MPPLFWSKIRIKHGQKRTFAYCFGKPFLLFRETSWESLTAYPALTPASLLHYIAGMAKKNKTTTAAQNSGNKEYEKHVCGECKRCTPVKKFSTLTVKDRRPTLGRCPESTCSVLLSQRACKNIEL